MAIIPLLTDSYSTGQFPIAKIFYIDKYVHTVKLCLEKSDWAHFCGKTTIILIFNLIFAQNLIPFFFQALFLKFCILEGHYVWKKSGNALFLEKITIV